MHNIGETKPGDNRATWLLTVRVPDFQGGCEVLLGDCRLDFFVNESAPLLRCTMKVEIPAGDIAERRLQTGSSIPLNMELGIFTLTCPLRNAHLGRAISVAVRMTPARIELFVDGVLVDEEWPWTPLRGDGAVTVRSDRVTCEEFFNRDLSDAELFERMPRADEKRATELLGVDSIAPQYWRPRGHNTTAGDVMLCVHKDELHLFYLFDRRMHGSKWYAGAHQFHHMSSTDLRTWTQHPPAISINEPWEAIGTGTCVSDGERMILFYEQHGERFLDGRSRRGMWYASSDDGVNFTKHQGHCEEIVQPGVFKADDGVTWNIISGQKRFTSGDLIQWTCAESDFLPALPGMSNECPCYFSAGGWRYIATGRIGFFMSRDSHGPFWNKPESSAHVTTPAWDIYDGLMVPSIVTFKGRLILAGWISACSEPSWGGLLVVRELQQRADGNLYMRWLPDLIPQGGKWSSLELRAGTNARVENAAVHLEPPKSEQLAIAKAALSLPASSSFHLKLNVALDKNVNTFSLVLGDFSAPDSALELRFEPRQQRIQWGEAGHGALAPESHGNRADGVDFAIKNVEGMDDTFSIDLIVKRLQTGTVVDAAFSFGRTMITRRTHMKMDRLCVLASGGAAVVSGVAVREIQ